jgi:hypothetical protein
METSIGIRDVMPPWCRQTPGISESGIMNSNHRENPGERNHAGLFDILILFQVQECKMTSHKHSGKQSTDIFIEDFEFMKEGMVPDGDCSSYATCVNELVRGISVLFVSQYLFSKR